MGKKTFLWSKFWILFSFNWYDFSVDFFIDLQIYRSCSLTPSLRSKRCGYLYILSENFIQNLSCLPTRKPKKNLLTIHSITKNAWDQHIACTKYRLFIWTFKRNSYILLRICVECTKSSKLWFSTIHSNFTSIYSVALVATNIGKEK